jgi:hypothetical protein
VNKRGAISLGVDLFEVDDEFGWIMLGICQYFGAKEGDNMVRDDLDRLVPEVGVIDTEVCVKPLNLVHYERVGNETLEAKDELLFCLDMRAAALAFPATISWTLARCSALPLNTGVLYPGRFLTRCSDASLPP